MQSFHPLHCTCSSRHAETSQTVSSAVNKTKETKSIVKNGLVTQGVQKNEPLGINYCYNLNT